MTADWIAVLAAAQILVTGVYLFGVAVDAGVAIIAGLVAAGKPHFGTTVVASLGPLPLLNAVWVVVAGGLLIGAFPAAEVALFDAYAPLVLGAMTAAVALLIGLVLHRFGQASGLHFSRVAAIAGTALILSTSTLTWSHGGQDRLTMALGAVTQVVASVAVGASFCRARLGTRTPEPLQSILNRATRSTSLVAAASAVGLLSAQARNGDAAVGLVVSTAVAIAALLYAAASRGLAFASAALAWSAVVAPQLSMSFDYLQRTSGDAATTRVLALVVICLLPCLMLAQAATWWWIGRRSMNDTTSRSW